MKHIAKVVLENFQSHANSILTFGPGLNVITGPSDNGKSAVLRAIRWALYNEPRGSDFVRTGCRECAVTVVMSDGAEIRRELLLSKSGATARSRYVVTNPGADPQVFEGFGTEPPLEVVQAHGMPQVLLDTDKRVALNYGSQLEGPFLMAETGSVRARAIGRLLGVHVVDSAIRTTQRDIRGLKTDAARLQTQVERLGQELEPFADLPAQEERLHQAETLIAQIEARLVRLNELLALQQEILQLQQQIAQTEAERTRAEAIRQAALSQYRDLLQETGVCPTCLQPLGAEAVEHMVAELAGGPPAVHRHTEEG